MSEAFTLSPIGVVRSPFKNTRDVPVHGGPATLEVDATFARGLEGLEHSSHLIVMGYLHLADRSVLQARPVKMDPGAPPRGVFATRSPARPNPVSVTVVPVLSSHGLCIEVDHLDLVDGTPLVDLKTYSPGWDTIFWARHQHRARLDRIDDERLGACLERDLACFMGPAAKLAGARWALAGTFIATRALGIEPRDPGLQVTVNRDDVTAEGLMALTGAARFNERLRVSPDEEALRIAFHRDGRGIELVAASVNPPRQLDGCQASFTTRITEA